MLGDLLSRALDTVGITEDRVSSWLGKPCNCKERREKLNRIGFWAKRVLSGKTNRAEEYLDAIMSDEQ